MADTVRYLLEEMIPELEDLEERGYFTRGEIKQIVKRRTDFEYLLKRRAALRVDYLKYGPFVITCCETAHVPQPPQPWRGTVVLYCMLSRQCSTFLATKTWACLLRTPGHAT